MDAMMLKGILPADTDTPEATQALGRSLGARLSPGDIVALYGDLGAGKTRLAKGICEAFGIDPETVTSPTFTLINEYRGNDLDVYHIDAYRLKTLTEFFRLGYEEYFFGEGVTMIEWPERVEEVLPPETIRVRIEHLGETTRHIADHHDLERS